MNMRAEKHKSSEKTTRASRGEPPVPLERASADTDTEEDERAEAHETTEPNERKTFLDRATGWPHWTTPEKFLQRVRKIGPIILDPCSNDASTVDAQFEFFGVDQDGFDGLGEPWGKWVRQGRAPGVVYVNPPYGSEVVGWAEKMCDEAEELKRNPKWLGTIALLPCRTDPDWMHRYVFGTVKEKPAICASNAWVFWRGRWQFGNPPPPIPGKKQSKSNTVPSLVAFWGPAVDQFCDIFGDGGLLIR